jgi:DUF4097 and DUF4098 domain-containing protein YvlB
MNIKGLNIGGSVTIDGRTFRGNNISIDGSKVIVDGVVQEGELVGDVQVTVQGDCESVSTTNGDISVEGSVKTVSTVNGDVSAGSITGKTSTVNGDISV